LDFVAVLIQLLFIIDLNNKYILNYKCYQRKNNLQGVIRLFIFKRVVKRTQLKRILYIFNIFLTNVNNINNKTIGYFESNLK
jgi:hypothetical protein